jgi:hypothetical protein
MRQLQRCFLGNHSVRKLRFKVESVFLYVSCHTSGGFLELLSEAIQLMFKKVAAWKVDHLIDFDDSIVGFSHAAMV